MEQNNKNAGANKAVIVGAGPVGCLMAALLVKRHSDLFPDGIEIYEKRSDSRYENCTFGRSINLTLSSRAFKALSAIDPEFTNDVMKSGCKLFSRCIHPKLTHCQYQPYGLKDQFILSVDRRWLNEYLLTKIEKFQNLKLFFNHSKMIQSNSTEFFDASEYSTLCFWDESTKKVHTTRCRFVFACDGAHSAIRTMLTSHPKARMSFSQTYMPYGYKELRITMNAKTMDFALRSDCLHVWPRQKFMLMAFPNPAKDFTISFFSALNQDEAHKDSSSTKNHNRSAFSELDTDQKVLQFFKEEFSDIYELIQDNLLKDWKINPASSLFHAECEPFYLDDKVVILGDAAHAVVPFSGQGVNSGFEDCWILSNYLSSLDHLRDRARVKQLLHQYSIKRKPACDALSYLSQKNYHVLTSKTASTSFTLKKKLELSLHHLFPNHYKPFSIMLSFCPELSYDQILVKHQKQEKWTMRTFCFIVFFFMIALIKLLK